jgi:hypothetical protein
MKYGFCACGCGRKTKLAPQSSTKYGWVKDRPFKYLRGHAVRGRDLSPRGSSRRIVISGVKCRTIPLPRGYEAIVDAGEYNRVSAHRWFARVDKTYRIYVYAHLRSRGKLKIIKLHRLILPNKNRIDHKNGNGLDNRMSNLRPATGKQNVRNQRKRRRGYSKFKGVSWDKRRNKWIAQIGVNSRHLFLGYHLSEKAAAKAYDVAAREHYGEFACVNFPLKGEQGCLK